jgi:hypothetical protein
MAAAANAAKAVSMFFMGGRGWVPGRAEART